MVVRKRDHETEPGIWIFDHYDEAAMWWDRVQENWTDVYFCRIAYGPEGSGMSGERPIIPAIKAHPVEEIAVARTDERGLGGARAEEASDVLSSLHVAAPDEPTR